jgi:hypothetical protein
VNHIGDINKMVSDTPRTDAELEFDPTSVDEVLDWSRQLERELNAANDRIKRLDETLEAVTDKIDNAWGIYMKFKEAKP